MADLTLPNNVDVNMPSTFKFKGRNLASIINELLKYVFPLAGLILFFMLIAGGFQLLTSIGNPEKTKKGYQKIVFALIGFLVIFISYWLMQILEKVLGIRVLES